VVYDYAYSCKDKILFLGLEMAVSMRNATEKLFPWVVLELPCKEILGKGGVKTR